MHPGGSAWWKETFVPQMFQRISGSRGFGVLEAVVARLKGKEIEVAWLVETAPHRQSGDLGLHPGPCCFVAEESSSLAGSLSPSQVFLLQSDLSWLLRTGIS